MAKVKPYIITIKYAAFYEDPRPTPEQVLNELNLDALEVTIEDAIVLPRHKTAEEPIKTTEATTRSTAHREAITVEAEEPTEKSPRMFSKADAPFDTFHLDRDGPAIKILSSLYGLRKGRKMSEIKEATSLRTTALSCTITRLKSQGRIKVGATAPDGSNIYVFVK